MKAIVYNLWVLSILLFCHLAYGQKASTKQWEKSFTVPKSQRLFLENQHGDILVRGWERDEALIKVSISIDSKNGSRPRTLLDQVEIKEEQIPEGVKIISSVQEVKKGFWDKYISSGNRNAMDIIHLKIDYEVYVPKDLALDIQNRFGDLIVDGWNGELAAVIGHGDIWVNNHLEQAWFTLEYGTLKTKSLGQSIVKVANGEVDMDNVEALELHSEGSEIKLGQISRLIMTSDKDEVKMDKVGALKIKSKFSRMTVDTLSHTMAVSMKLSELKVKRVSDPELQISIDQESSDIHLNVSGVSFGFKAILTEGLLRIPKSFKNIQSEVLDEKKRIREVHAVYGTPHTGRMSIKGDKGIVILSEN